jgi:hypothetical protein
VSVKLEAFLLRVLRLAAVLNASVIFARHDIGFAEWAVLPGNWCRANSTIPAVAQHPPF